MYMQGPVARNTVVNSGGQCRGAGSCFTYNLPLQVSTGATKLGVVKGLTTMSFKINKLIKY